MTSFRRALVLGGHGGLLGQALMDVLRASGWEAEGTGRSSIDYAAPDAGACLEALVEKLEPDCIFNAVGYTRVDDAEEHPAEADLLNRALPSMVGRVAKNFHCRLVHYSTDFVFSGKKGTPYTVEDTPDPVSVYGKTKLAGEEALLALGLEQCLIIRTAWLFGPGKKNFVQTILDRCWISQVIGVVHDQVGSPTYTPDLACYSLKLVEAEGRGIYHVVNAGEASWCELASEAARLAQKECSINAIPSAGYPQKAIRPAYSVLDTTKFEQATGVTPRPWLQALQEYVFRAYPAEGT
ncbi:MAG: dTDP-4-dehydrorhamnose reductase [Desulfovibrio sp.]|jgi:dTDP-4-dehydrorhamnose reductase|nr:dTDP-4-dehydrorhamnose reductase [Desulfovibrio sp.]